MTLEIRILTPSDAGELFRLRRSSLLDSPLAFLASPEDDLASSEAAVRELLEPRRGTSMKKSASRRGVWSRMRFDSRGGPKASVTCGFHWPAGSVPADRARLATKQ